MIDFVNSKLKNIWFSETYPTNLYYKPRPEIQEYNREVAKYYQDLSGFGEEQMETFHDAAYYSVLARPGLRVMGWNSNYGWLG